MNKVILHIDLNCFYASIIMLYNPHLKNVPLAATGKQDERKGIILSKNNLAKKYGVITGESIVSAKSKCKNLICMPADYKLCLYYAEKVKKIYEDYTDRIESFGIDEAWLDISESIKLFHSADNIAKTIKKRIKFELGLTVSIGISYNKIYAKLASDLADEDSIYTIFPHEFDKIKNLQANAIIYVGPATYRKLKLYGIYTINDLVIKNVNFMKKHFGKMGEIIWYFAKGIDLSEVSKVDKKSVIKSLSNGTTIIEDLDNIEDIKIILIILAESIAKRLKEQGLYGKTISINLKYYDLSVISKQKTINYYTDLASDFIKYGLIIIKQIWNKKPVRALSVSISHLSYTLSNHQYSFFIKEEYSEKQKKLETAIDEIRRRFGSQKIYKGITACKDYLRKTEIKEEHDLHPVSYFRY